MASSRPTGVCGTSSGQAACSAATRLLGRLPQPVERLLLRAGRPDRRFDPLDRQVGQRRLGIAASAPGLLLLVLLTARRAVALIVRADRVEARLLLVGERLVELLQRRPHDPQRLVRRGQPGQHRLEPSGRCHRERAAARRLERLGGLRRRLLHLVEHGALLGRRLHGALDVGERPCGDALVGIAAELLDRLLAHARAPSATPRGGAEPVEPVRSSLGP